MFKHVKFTFTLVLFSVLSFSVHAAEGMRTCAEVFKGVVNNGRARISIPTALDVAKENSIGVVQAGFTNPRQDISASKTWSGGRGPRVVEDGLVPGTTLIEHQTKGATEEGLVKLGSGNMVHARFRLNEKESTTIGFNAHAIYDNYGRPVKSYVRKNAKAVVIFIHGGGTNTTGHHVAANLMDYLNPRDVDVISFDLPWHAMGDRNTRESILAELKRIEDYTRALIGDTKVPVFLAGHSMGGIVADLFRRLIPDSKVFDAFIPLSTVADPVPGGTPQQKLEEEERIARYNITNNKVAEAERNLGEMLMRQRKISPTCGMYCDLMILGLDWTIPAHRGSGYKPGLYIIGEGDALYQGYEKAFDVGVAGLKNTELVVYKESQDIKTGEATVVGHLIFDHVIAVRFKEGVSDAVKKSVTTRSISEEAFQALREKGDVTLGSRADGKDDLQFGLDDIGRPETFVRMKNFIAQVAKVKLEPRESQPPALKDIVQTYMNNLAFRAYADVHRTVIPKATKKGQETAKRFSDLNDMIRKLERKEKAGEITSAEEAELRQAKLARNLLDPIIKRKGEVAPEDVAVYERLSVEIEAYSRQINDVRNGKFLIAQRNSKGQQETRSTKELQESFEPAKQNHIRGKKAVAALADKVTSPALERVRAEREKIYGQMVAQDAHVRELSRRYITFRHKEGMLGADIIKNIPAEIVREFEKFNRLDQRYGKIDATFSEVLLEEGRMGRLRYVGEVPPGKTREGVDAEVHRTVSDYYATIAELKSLKSNLDARARVLEYLQDALYKAEMQMYGLVKGGYFEVESYTFADLLSRDVTELTSYTHYLSVKDQDIDRSMDEISKIKDADLKARTLELKGDPALRAKVRELRNYNTQLQKAWADWILVWTSRAISIVESNDSGI